MSSPAADRYLDLLARALTLDLLLDEEVDLETGPVASRRGCDLLR